MKPLYNNFNNKNKETLFNLRVYDVIDNIDKKIQEWFNETYIDVKPYIPNDVLVGNLLDNLDYMFTEAIWWIELGESLGYNMDSKRFVESMYNTYTSNPDGYKDLVRDERFCKRENRLYSDEEIKKNNEEMKKLSLEIVGEILNKLP